uniref:Bacteriophage P22 packaging genes n=1 Tax=Salmonella phage P22 TaxID=10754 RepID=Q38673_BPP22|nr:head completeion [Salmonella phage P22]
MYSQMMRILPLKVMITAFAQAQSARYSTILPAALLLIMRLRLLPKLSPLLNTEKSFSISKPPFPEQKERLTHHVCQLAVETVSPI